MKPEGGGLTVPQIAMAAISILTMTVGSYLAIQRDDSKEVQARFREVHSELNAHARQIAILETRLEYERNQREP